MQVCVPVLLDMLKMNEYADGCRWEIAGINHQAWLLSIADRAGTTSIRRSSAARPNPDGGYDIQNDLVRLDMMQRLGYYVTESSEHSAEYSMWYIKSRYPELIDRYNIPLDEYPRRCVEQIENWKKMRGELVENDTLSTRPPGIRRPDHRSHGDRCALPRPRKRAQYGLITNLPAEACVEVPCMIDRNGVTPALWGVLPEQLCRRQPADDQHPASDHPSGRHPQKEDVYRAAMLDPHTPPSSRPTTSAACATISSPPTKTGCPTTNHQREAALRMKAASLIFEFVLQFGNARSMAVVLLTDSRAQ